MQFRQIALVVPLTAEEWRSIEVFKKRALKLIEELGKLNIGEIGFDFQRRPDGGYQNSFTSALTLLSLDNLLALFVRFRSLHANDEPSNFRRVANMLARRAGPGLLRRFIDHIKEQERDSLVESGFFEVDGRQLRGSALVDLWFNAELFHSNLDKEKKLEGMTKLLSDDGFKSLLFLTVFSAACASKNLYYVIKDMSPANPFVQVPEGFIRQEDRSNSA